jgi:hypothetical protein
MRASSPPREGTPVAHDEPPMPGDRELDDVLEQLRRLLPTRRDPRTRYAIGRLVLRVRGAPDTYGRGAVANLATSAGADLATLYRQASVASRWTLDEVEALLAGRGASGLTWSHLVLLSAIESPEERREWCHLCLEERLSVRRLEAALAGTSRDDEGRARARAERTLQAAERLLDEMRRLDEDTGSRRLPPELVERALHVHERVRCFAELAMHRLHGRADPGDDPERCADSQR